MYIISLYLVFYVNAATFNVICVKKNGANQTGPKLLVRVQFPFPSRKHQPAAIAIPLPLGVV
jgi:hypothetical protein